MISGLLTARGKGKAEHVENNFPPCFPLMYHNISTECKGEKQVIAYLNIGIYLGFVVVLFADFIGSIFFTIYIPDVGTICLVTSIVYLLIFPFTSFFLMYLPGYNAAVSSYSIRYLVFYICYSLHIVWCIVCGVGVQGTGLGILTGICAFINGKAILGIWCLICAIIWWVLGCLMFVLMIWMNKFCTQDKASILKAKNALTTHFIKKSLLSNM